MKPKALKQNHVVAISYRDDAKGKGAFFDHFTLRRLTGCITEMTHSKNTDTTDLASHINYRNGYQMYGLPINPDLPTLATDDAENAAFLFIPGFTKDADRLQTATHQFRITYEKELIRKAIIRGQPVLAVCAGSWTLWQAYGGKTITVTDHNYGGAMPRLSTPSAEVCNNKMIHRVNVSPHSFLSGAMGFKETITERPMVNSVHWNAPDNSPPNAPTTLEITATSVKDDGIAPHSRKNDGTHQMQPDDSVEAFETKFGVPMLGIQWHPEAFNPGENPRQESIFKFIKEAGHTYLNRKALNKEFKEAWSNKAPNTTFFGNSKPDFDKVIPGGEKLINTTSSFKV